MTVVLWLVVPLAVTLLAVVWVTWTSRARPPVDIHETLEDYQRFKAAMEGGKRPGSRFGVGPRR